MGAIGIIINLFAAEVYKLNTFSFPFTSHFDSNFNQDQLHLHLTPASSWATVRASSSSNSLILSLWKNIEVGRW